MASGTYTFTATVQDPGGLTATATINLLVTNQPPKAIADAYFTGLTQFTFDPTLNDSDPEGPVSVQVVTPAGGGGGVVGVAGNSVTVSVPHGVSTFGYTIVDLGGLTDSSTITITSNNPPTAPDVSDTINHNQQTTNINLSPVRSRWRRRSMSVARRQQTSTSWSSTTRIPAIRAEANRVTLHVTVLTPGEFTSSFTCTSTDPFGAKATSTVTVTVVD